MFELMVEDSFNSAHQLKGYEGPCEKLHGHTWKVRAYFEGDKLDKLGMLEDFKVLKRRVRECLEELDHSNLNDLPTFKNINPTSENVAAAVWKKLKTFVGGDARLKRVTVFESPTASATYHE